MFGKIKQWLYKNSEFGKTRYLNYLYKYDMKQFFQYSCMNERNIENITAEIRILSHTIEKGMSLPNCRVGFGKEKIIRLINLCQKYEEQNHKKDMEVIGLAKSTISAYEKLQKECGVETDFIPKEYKNIEENSAGILLVDAKKKFDFAQIAYSRHSCRYYSEKKVEAAILEKIVELAQTAPSACNRQAIHIFACTNAEKQKKIMEMHGGVRGFGKPGVIFAVTGDLGLYLNEFERNAVFVDGGIFVMNLLYSLENFGLVGCPIIWGAEPDMDTKLREILNIPSSHKVVSLIMAGYVPEQRYKVAVSPRRNVQTILKVEE